MHTMRRAKQLFDIPAYYHVYNRGAGKRDIFNDAKDKAKFISLMSRYLDDQEYVRGDGVPYEKSGVDLVAYCLMNNHFHLFLFQSENMDDVQRFIKSLCSAYARYYNLRHKTSGYLFEGQFKAKRIDSDGYFVHISRYIHLNPRTYMTYKWSSLPEYTGRRVTSWVHPELATEMTAQQYTDFLGSYVDRATELRKLKDDFNLK